MTRSLLPAVLIVSISTTALAGLPCRVDAHGAAFRRGPMPVVYNLVGGRSSSFGWLPRLAAIGTAAGRWEAVDSADIHFAAGATLRTDDSEAFSDYWGECGDRISPILFDTSGSLIDAALGEGAALTVVGLTLQDCPEDSVPVVRESSVIVNTAAFSDDLAAVTNVLTHELGHVLDICHSRLNGELVDDGDAANDVYVPAMYPVLSQDSSAMGAFLTFDDRATASMLYPADGFFSAGGTVAGYVVIGSDNRPVSGAGVVVRSDADPLGTAFWTSAGWLPIEGPRRGPIVVGTAEPAVAGGWQASGLPPGSYTAGIDTASGPAGSTAFTIEGGELRTDITLALPGASPAAQTTWDVRWRGVVEADGDTAPVPRDMLPETGRLAIGAVGHHQFARAPGFNGTWSARGRRQRRLVLAIDKEAFAAGVDPALRINRIRGRGRIDPSGTFIRGQIAVSGTVLFQGQRVPFVIRFFFRGPRAGDADGALGELPLVSADKLVVTAALPRVRAGESVVFTAAGDAATAGVTWEMVGEGTIDPAGTYTAPASVVSPQRAIVVARGGASMRVIGIAETLLLPGSTVDLAAGNSVESSLSTTGEIDYFLLAQSPTQPLRILVTSPSIFLSPCIELVDTYGVVTSPSCEAQVDIPAGDGDVLLLVRADYAFDTGSYSISATPQ